MLAARLGVLVIDVAIALGASVVLNINVPNLEPSEVRGVRVASLARAAPEVTFDDRGALRWHAVVTDSGLDSDVPVLRAGSASVTAVQGHVDPVLLAEKVAEVQPTARICNPGPLRRDEPIGRA